MSLDGTVERGPVLLALARGSLVEALHLGRCPELREPWLEEPGACFVTLHRSGALRGCVGSIEAHRPLRDDVRANARAAAFSDTRFAPVTADELPQLDIEVSLLSAPEPLPVTSEADALRLLRPGQDGVVLEWGHHRATFLPQVWEQLPDPRDFLAQLRRKAGLPQGFWDPEVRLSRYQVEKWEEGE